MRKPAFFICENKDADQLRVNRTADQRLCFCRIDIVQYLYFLNLNTKFLASSYLLCVRPSQEPRRQVSQHGSYYRNDPKFSERQFWANSADPVQTAPRGGVS